MTSVATDAPAVPKERSFARLLLAVLLGYIGALTTFSLAALPLLFLWVLPRPWVWPGPFPIDGAWSLDADIVVTALIVLVTAWWIRRMVEGAVKGHVSLGVVALAVAVTGYAPLLTLTPKVILPWGIVALVATTWLVRGYAIGTAPRFSRSSWRVWLALGLVGLAVLGSYRVYHPLVATNLSGGGPEFTLKNSDWVNVTLLGVGGGWVGTASGELHPYKLPYTLGSRARIGVYANAHSCVPSDVVIRFAVLGVTTTQRFSFTPDAPGNGSGTDLPSGAGCDEYPYAR